MKFLKYLLSSIVFLMVFTVNAQVVFEAKVSKNKLGVNERLRIDFNMNEDGDNFNPPDFSDFTIISGPNQAVSVSYMNGQKKFNKTYSFFLAPKGRGTFKINQATIEIAGETYKTSPVTVNVTQAVEVPTDVNSADYIASEKIHLVAEVSKANPYLNEGISVVYKLYVAMDTGVTNWRELDNPRFDDFWSQNIPMNGVKIEKGQYNGEEYRYVVLRKAVLYPQKTGKLDIEPLTLDITVDVPSNRRDFFGRRVMSQVHKTVSAGSRSINVKPLPEKDKPLDFSGAVGDFKFNVITSKTELNASESLEAKVEVTGKGNLKLFTLPKLTVPGSLEVYEPEHSENVTTDLGGMKGGISDSYTIVPQFKGKYPIPSVSFSYFDLNTETYKRVSSGEIVIDVIEGPINNTSSDNNISAVNGTKQEVRANANQFAFIKTNTNLKSVYQPQFFNSTWFWSSLLLPLLAIPLALFIKHRKEERDSDIIGNRLRNADKLARRYLGEAKKNLGNKEDFYVALEKALHNYLKAKLRIETSDFTKEHIRTILIERKVNQTSTEEFIGLLKNCELARYTPITTVEMQQDYDKAAQAISTIDKELS
ncbi:Oxygen tolerance [Flavobacteriaceae bacterium MAR_2010_188]|nr:Oxygen tolerance [Flavobacteriaceae bacterium MAR_2010_188]